MVKGAVDVYMAGVMSEVVLKAGYGSKFATDAHPPFPISEGVSSPMKRFSKVGLWRGASSCGAFGAR